MLNSILRCIKCHHYNDSSDPSVGFLRFAAPVVYYNAMVTTCIWRFCLQYNILSLNIWRRNWETISLHDTWRGHCFWLVLWDVGIHFSGMVIIIQKQTKNNPTVSCSHLLHIGQWTQSVTGGTRASYQTAASIPALWHHTEGEPNYNNNNGLETSRVPNRSPASDPDNIKRPCWNAKVYRLFFSSIRILFSWNVTQMHTCKITYCCSQKCTGKAASV